MTPPLERINNYSAKISQYSKNNKEFKRKLKHIILLLISRLNKLKNKVDAKSLSQRQSLKIASDYENLKQQTERITQEKRRLEDSIRDMHSKHESTLQNFEYGTTLPKPKSVGNENLSRYGMGMNSDMGMRQQQMQNETVRKLKSELEKMKFLQEENRKLTIELESIGRALDKLYSVIADLLASRQYDKKDITEILETLKTSEKILNNNLGEKNPFEVAIGGKTIKRGGYNYLKKKRKTNKRKKQMKIAYSRLSSRTKNNFYARGKKRNTKKKSHKKKYTMRK